MYLYCAGRLLISDLRLLRKRKYDRVARIAFRRKYSAFISRRLHPEAERNIARRHKHPLIRVIREHKLHIKLIRKHIGVFIL